MARDREFWRTHVEGWRTSGLSQKEYSRRHRLAKGTLGYWSSKLRQPGAGVSDLVEVGRAEVKEDRPSRPIELVVEGRYLLRLWPGTEGHHLREVLSALEGRG